ncbi:MAG TPA: tRNA (adenosine(37)-N6)-threonylcarbamoyltransferase complex ATPase subunit type 1 TsaE [Arenibacter sp.]|nr:tRNA (adenosine(37)-N6)-threonylcarbamoyltransferase complex ATPase subunit type 1 TsaE [Arenibacter sp.]
MNIEMNTIYTQVQIREVAQKIIRGANSKVLCFHGEMGAGKTTLIKAMVRELGGADIGSSPTFGIVNEYQLPTGELLGYHFDFYRLENETEALDLGLDDYLYSNAWIFMEWPEKIPSLLPDDAAHIYINIIDHKTRSLTVGNSH